MKRHEALRGTDNQRVRCDMKDRHPVAQRLDDGSIGVAYQKEIPGGSVFGGMIIIGPDTPDYEFRDSQIKAL